MLTVYATVDENGIRALWYTKPHFYAVGTRNPLRYWATADGLGQLSPWATGEALLRTLFPRGMKPGEIRKFKIPRLGE